MRIKSFMQKFARDERGVSALEYAILAAMIVVAVVAAGPKITKMFEDVFDSTATKVTEGVNNAGNGGGSNL